MALISGKKMHVFVEVPDGTVYDISGYVNNMSIRQNMDLATEVDFSLMGSVTMFSGDAFGDVLLEKRAAPEWQCSYCQSPNSKIHRHCTQCGGSRSFIYE